VRPEEFAREFPCLFHVADIRGWRSILDHGLLSVSAVCEALQLSAKHREKLESQRRTTLKLFEKQPLGTVVLREQGAIHPRALEAALVDMTVHDWYRELSRRVFFFPSAEAMRPLLETYHGQRLPQAVFRVDAARLLTKHAQDVSVSAINTGSAKRRATPRGAATFERLADFEYAAAPLRRHGIAEVTVDWAVPDFVEYVINVERVDAQGSEQLWQPPET